MRPTTFHRPLGVDAALGAALALAGVVGSAIAANVSRPAAPIDPLGYVLVAAAALALSARRRWPLAALAAATLCTSGYLIMGYAYGPILIIFMIAVYSGTRYAPSRPAAWSATAAPPLMLIHLLTSDRQLGGLGVVPVAAWVGVPAAIGDSLRLRQQAAETAGSQA